MVQARMTLFRKLELKNARLVRSTLSYDLPRKGVNKEIACKVNVIQIVCTIVEEHGQLAFVQILPREGIRARKIQEQSIKDAHEIERSVQESIDDRHDEKNARGT